MYVDYDILIENDMIFFSIFRQTPYPVSSNLQMTKQYLNNRGHLVHLGRVTLQVIQIFFFYSDLKTFVLIYIIFSRQIFDCHF